jgi:replicative DNA helicase
MQNFKSKTENRVQELSQITRSLKSIAREFNIPVIALSQLSRNVETRINKRPQLSDLRESGSIEQDADLVLMLFRENYYNLKKDQQDLAEIIVAKHRNGPTGTIQLKFDANCIKFSNYN